MAVYEQFTACIQQCNLCAVACDYCASACLEEDDPKPLARCVALNLDCAPACRVAVSYMARGSDAVRAVCEFCAERCEACAEECVGHFSATQTYQHCRDCAEACYRCAEECRRVAGLLGGVSSPSL
jgi:hypothetical protein